jgi:CDP-diacylglycerol--serine O-phosphatidyltransferase
MIKLLSVADVISITNAVFGVLAILVLFTNLDFKIHLSLSLILLGLLADGLDGILARYVGKSDIGEYLESMADMTTMVVAPAVFIFFTYMDVLTGEAIRQVFLFVALILFFSFGIVRLASFNIMKKKNIYVGLPASASAIILLILSFFEVELMLILFATVVIGALMASDILFLKPGKLINAAALVLILLTIAFGQSYYGFAPILLFCAIMIYTFGGPIYKKFLEKSR